MHQHNHKFVCFKTLTDHCLHHICDKDSIVLNFGVSGIGEFPGRSEITTSKPEKVL